MNLGKSENGIPAAFSDCHLTLIILITRSMALHEVL